MLKAFPKKSFTKVQMLFFSISFPQHVLLSKGVLRPSDGQTNQFQLFDQYAIHFNEFLKASDDLENN